MLDQRGNMINTTVEAVKAAPAITVSTMVILGHPISDYAVLATLVYTLFLLYVLIRDKIYEPAQKRKRVAKAKHKDLKTIRAEIDEKAAEVPKAPGTELDK
jgi:type III secretory pathway component EscV